ncbi:peptidoglycan-binding protein [Clostridium sp. CS001]|uniref:peptidoglycan-binding domain-containing protein n=1 Tax=Clostridium sp. CS001 TaxID=2880648 RepID=UPI001CF543B2|nr:peptidoglycan-binding domain-containing protein [Clostridium sp. CS001]MCB2288560.1 peptidoglycan-binding protein [Clostridium sp. CS001]
MKKVLKPLNYSLIAIFALTIAVASPKLGSFNVDSVSAATGAAPAPAPTKQSTPAKQATPTKSVVYNTSVSATRLLKFNSMGDDVKRIQTSLNSKGYKITVDGIFGKLTLNAVKDFQSKNKLAADGLVGPATLAKLNEKPAVPKPTTPPVVAPPVVTPPVAAVPNVDSISAASKTYYYESSSLTGVKLMDAIKARSGATSVATTNQDGTPNIATVVPGVADENHLQFGISPNQTSANILERKIAVLTFYIYNPTAVEKADRNIGARVVLKLVEDETKIKDLMTKTKAAEGTIFMEIVKVLPLG